MTYLLVQFSGRSALIRIVSQEMSIVPVLVEKDYWIMHCLYGLKKSGMTFFMKGGTSLSKGYKLIQRFSEDIDILIEPPSHISVSTGHNQDKKTHRESRKVYYDWLSQNLKIEGIHKVERDIAFDDAKYRSGGIRLLYPTQSKQLKDLKEGILLEVGFDSVKPNSPRTISSWAYDFAKDKVDLEDNQAKDILCYHPGYTLVEKLQTISTKFRKQQEQKTFSDNFMRHYYDVSCLLKEPEILSFIGTEEYSEHKKKRFRQGDNPDLASNEAFLLQDKEVRAQYENQYNLSKSLYYQEKPNFDEIMTLIQRYLSSL